ncbi:MAG TPA: hypothetical protein VMS77_06015 [Conexivisphaerales archaeon]|nr:hypothetical protein [Conexivisphaerales archaeon]
MAEDFQPTLEGKDLRVYWLLLNRGRAGPREVQRSLHFSSVTVATHHLEKLSEMGLAVKDEEGKYEVTREISTGSLRLFTKVGRLRFPRLVFYMVLTITVSASYLLLAPPIEYLPKLFILMLTAIVVAFLGYESWIIWREAPL